MTNYQKGILLTILSTLTCGITPIISKVTYSMGNNGIQLAFLKHLFVVPIFLSIVVYKKLSLRLTQQQFKDIFIIGISNAFTFVTLFCSYDYISVGTATVLHFLYPLFVCLINYIFYQQKLSRKQLFCLVISLIGVFCFIESSISSTIGFILAISSSLFFAYYMIGVDHSSIRELSPFVFNFYLVSLNVIVIGILALTTQSFHMMPFEGYLLSGVVSILSSLIAVVLLQRGVHYLGASLASILSAIEPVVSLTFGLVFLNEVLFLLPLIGCFLILVSTYLLIKIQNT